MDGVQAEVRHLRQYRRLRLRGGSDAVGAHEVGDVRVETVAAADGDVAGCGSARVGGVGHGGGGCVFAAEERLRGGRELWCEMRFSVVFFHERDGPCFDVDGGAFRGLEEGFFVLFAAMLVFWGRRGKCEVIIRKALEGWDEGWGL